MQQVYQIGRSVFARQEIILHMRTSGLYDETLIIRGNRADFWGTS